MSDYAAQLAEWERVNKLQLANGQRPNWPKLLDIAKELAAIVAALFALADEPDDDDDNDEPQPESEIDRDCRQYHEGA